MSVSHICAMTDEQIKQGPEVLLRNPLMHFRLARNSGKYQREDTDFTPWDLGHNLI